MGRLISLDVLRGITIAFMIMVNNNGGPGSWRFMNHAYWNGLTATDLVFPTFVLVVGASIVFAFHARMKRGATRAELARHTIQRAVILYLLGIVVNGFPFFRWEHLRFYGVLQRLAVCYLVGGFFYIWGQGVSTTVGWGGGGGAGGLLAAVALGSGAGSRDAGARYSFHGHSHEPGELA